MSTETTRLIRDGEKVGRGYGGGGRGRYVPIATLSPPGVNKHGGFITSTETIRLIRDGEKVGRGYGGGGRGRLYTYRYTVTTRMTPALRWAAMRAMLMFH